MKASRRKWEYLYGLLVQELDQLRSRVLILEQRDGDQERAADLELAHLAGQLTRHDAMMAKMRP